MKPAFKHDCDKCTFIGRFQLNPDRGNSKVDVYQACDNTLGKSYIVRYSNKGGDYAHTLERYLGKYVTI